MRSRRNWVALGGKEKKSEEKKTERHSQSKASQRADYRTKAQGGFMQNRRSRGERMTSEKYATAVVHYLR